MNQKREIIAEDVVNVCNGQLVCGNLNTVLDSFCQDTRKIQLGDVYIGIKGEHHNGNDIYKEALENGAKACILQQIEIPEDIKKRYSDRTILIVQDTIDALQKLATYKRNMYDIPVVAITGSVGKTSTKDIVASVMSKKYHVLKTEENYNSQLGVALTVLRLKEHTAMVIELGMSKQGEIRKLTHIVKPTVAVITNVGTAHIGNLGSRDNILKAKLEILEGLQEEGILVINHDNDLLHEWNEHKQEKHHVVTYGIDAASDIMAYHTVLKENGSDYDIQIDENTYHVHVGIGGNHFISNSLCAIAVGRIFEIPMEKILEGIAHFELTKRRMQVEKLENGNTIINDCYNANTDSMIAAIEYLSKIQANTRIAVLGDMLELGEYSHELHRKVGKEVVNYQIDILITVGKEAESIADEALKQHMNAQQIYIYHTNEDAIIKLKELVTQKGVAVLIKASNGMSFQEIANAIITK